MLKENQLLSSIDNCRGEIIFVYSDRHNIYVIYHSKEDNQIYLVLSNKHYEIERTVSIVHGLILFKGDNIKWFKPLHDGGNITFLGHVVDEGKTYHFSFSDIKPTLKISEHHQGTQQLTQLSYDILSCMENIEVTHGIQRWGVFYFTGHLTDEGGDIHPVYGEVDLSLDKLSRVYFLYSDLGEIQPSCISIDTDDNRVYVVGKLTKEDGDIVPYIETFFYRNSPYS